MAMLLLLYDVGRGFLRPLFGVLANILVDIIGVKIRVTADLKVKYEIIFIGFNAVFF